MLEHNYFPCAGRRAIVATGKDNMELWVTKVCCASASFVVFFCRPPAFCGDLHLNSGVLALAKQHYIRVGVLRRDERGAAD